MLQSVRLLYVGLSSLAPSYAAGLESARVEVNKGDRISISVQRPKIKWLAFAGLRLMLPIKCEFVVPLLNLVSVSDLC